jgi:hypothetical protein
VTGGAYAIGLTVLSVLLCACGTPGTEAHVALGSDAVIDGRPSPSGTREDAIVMLRSQFDDFAYSCSATLVAKNLVLTARHCLAYGTPGPFSCDGHGQLLDDGSGAGRLGLDLPADTLEFYSGDGADRTLVALGKKVISSLSETACIDDLGFVLLDRDVDLPRLPLRIGQSARVGEAVTLTGYGIDETMGLNTAFDQLTRHTRDDLEIDAVGPNDTTDASTIPPRAVLLLGAAGCVGDSGGPLYARDTGAVLGVYSLGVGDSCTGTSVVNIFAHVPVYTGLIGDAFAAAGADPIAEGTLGVVGDDCGSKTDCLDGVCQDFGDGRSRCSRSCKRNADCPSGFECDASVKLCAPKPAPDSTPDAGAAGAGTAGEPAQAGSSAGASETGGSQGSAEGGSPSSAEGGAGATPTAAGTGGSTKPTRGPKSSHGGCTLAARSSACDARAALGSALLLSWLAARRRAQGRVLPSWKARSRSA